MLPAPRLLACGLALCVCAATRLTAQPADAALPHLVRQDGRHALIVDGAPFLILGGQCHNSSAWPATLPAVWSTIERLHANTLEVPISWEQFEPEPGRFDPAIVDLLLAQAREHHVRLVLLWFGTWKNGSAHYLPLWLKSDPAKYRRVLGRDGRPVDSPSPHSPALLEADKRAFAALMRHLKAADPQHTVIMVQVENEPGTWNSVRDFSPAAESLFAAPVPAELLAKLGRPEAAGQDWKTVFRADADEFFHAWSVARYIGEVAAAGKAEYPLPLYVNAALRDPLTPPTADKYESGGPTDNVLEIWQAAAPAIDLLAPDIYQPETARYLKVLDLYRHAGNPLFVPETIGSPALSRFCYAALARGAIGWSPFGVDRPRSPATGRENEPDPLAAMYAALGSSQREFARLAYAGQLHAALEEKDQPIATLTLGHWRITAKFGPPAMGFGREPTGNPEPVGRALIGQLGENDFVVTAYLGRVDFQPLDATPTSGPQREYLRVEEGSFEQGVFKPIRIWNGDETDWGLNFNTAPVVLRVRLSTF